MQHKFYMRCSICDGVSSAEIGEKVKDFHKVSFHQDPHDPTALVCSDCTGPILEVLSDYYYDDEEKEIEDDEIISADGEEDFFVCGD